MAGSIVAIGRNWMRRRVVDFIRERAGEFELDFAAAR
jgi:hypothetical protein